MGLKFFFKRKRQTIERIKFVSFFGIKAFFKIKIFNIMRLTLIFFF